MKIYGEFRADLANVAAVSTFLAANPTHYKAGSLIVALDGGLCVVLPGGATSNKVTAAPN